MILIHPLPRRFQRPTQTPYRALFYDPRTARDVDAMRDAELAAVLDHGARSTTTASGRACHPLQPFVEWSACDAASHRLGAVLIAGCRDAFAARQLGFVPVHGLGAALEMARGRGARRIGYLLTPPFFPLVVGSVTETRSLPSMDTVIETRALTKRFGDRAAVDSVDLTVPAGVAFGFLGPNGAGKTTMIRTLLGLTQPTSGDVSLLGLPQPAKRAEALARVGAIVEEPKFHPHLTGRENLKIVAAARDRAAEARIAESLERVGLAQRGDDRVKTYSLGMRQRLGIARCLIADPALLILDEPMNGLDPAGHPRDAASDPRVRRARAARCSSPRTCSTRSRRRATRSRSSTRAGSSCREASPRSPRAAIRRVLIEVDDEAAAGACSTGRTIEEEGGALRVRLTDGLTSAARSTACSSRPGSPSRGSSLRARRSRRSSSRSPPGWRPTSEARSRRGAEARAPTRSHGVVADPHGRRPSSSPRSCS